MCSFFSPLVLLRYQTLYLGSNGGDTSVVPNTGVLGEERELGGKTEGQGHGFNIKNKNKN